MTLITMTDCLLKGKRFFCREWAFIKLLHCLDTRPFSKTCGTLVMGGSGSGKTALGCEIVWPTSPQGKQGALKSRLLAYHFCQAHDNKTLSVAGFIKNLVTQVCASHLVKDFKSRGSSLNINNLLDTRKCEVNADEVFRVAFLEPLLASEPPDETLMLWVDSIDESHIEPGSDRGTCSQTIAELLAAHIGSFPPWLLLVCTARKQSKGITRLFTGFRKLSLDDLRKSHIVRDVQQYILCRLDAEDGLRQHLSRDTAEMLNQLHIKSNGCFLYLEMVLDGVAESFIMLREVREIPGTLNGLYLWLCQRLFVKKHFAQIQSILNVLLASQSPLGSDELYQCMLVRETDLSKEEFDRRLKLMSRILFSGVNQEHTIFHHSFAEWLLDVKHCTQKYLCDVTEGHAVIAIKQLRHAKELSPLHVQDLALHLVRARFPEAIRHEHLTQLLVLSGANVEKCFSADLPKDTKVLKLLTDAGAKQLSQPEVPAVSRELFTNQKEEMDMKNEYICLAVNETDANGRTPVHLAAYKGDLGTVTALLASGTDLELEDRSGQTALTLAARQGHADVVAAIVKAGANVDHTDHEGWTALRSAAWAGHSNVVAMLLDQGAQVDHADAEQRTALRAACWGGHEDVVRLLLDYQADVNKMDHEGRTALIAAAYMGHVEIVEQLLEHGAQIDHEDCDGRTALSVACLCVPASEGHEKVVSLLLERGSEVDHTDKDGSTPLLVAAYEGHAGVCEMLLEWDADIDHVDNKGITPLWAATSMGHEEVVRQLMFWGAAIDHIDPDGRSVLCVAAAQGSESVVRQFLDRGLDEMHRDNSGWTPLHLASYEGHLQVTIMLLEQGAKPNEVDKDGRIALIQGSQEGHLEVVKRLVEAGSNVNHRSHDGKTASRVAAVEGHVQVLEYLLSMGADINYKDADSRTTLYVIALDGNLEMTETLLAHGADIEAVDVEGRTALHVAAWQGNVEIVKVLVEYGAQVNSVDNDHRTAVQSASWQGHDEVVKLLLEAGARVDHTCNQGATALCIAAQEGHEDVVRTLLNSNANPNHADQFGRTPYRVALKSNHNSICKLLEDFGAIIPNGAKTQINSLTSSGDIKMNTPLSTSQETTAESLGSFGIKVTTIMVQPLSSASSESTSDHHKSYHSNSSKSSGSLTSSTNWSSQSGLGNLSRLDRECLTFTQQLQQCSVSKNRSRPISRVLSPVSEPQSPLHSPCITPVNEATSDAEHNINIMVSSPIKTGSFKQDRISAAINIITNPHVDMMSSVEEPVWQINPAHPVNNRNIASSVTSSGVSSNDSQFQQHPYCNSPTADSPSRIIMGRKYLNSKSPETKRKRNGIVTNPKVNQPGSSKVVPKYNMLSHSSDSKSACNSCSNITSGNSTSPVTDASSPSNLRSPSAVFAAFETMASDDGSSNQLGGVKAVRPNGLPIKKINSQHFH